jgi:diguanylate cyclase (GGDEF)-like protein
MSNQVLIVNDSLNIADLAQDAAGGLQVITTSTGKDGLATLALSTGWCAVLAASQLPDMSGIAFLQQAAALSEAIPLLLAPDAQLVSTLHQANSASLFRVVPECTPKETLKTIILDAARQFRLVQQERQLREQLKLLTTIDPLTGCSSRIHLQEHIRKELKRSRRYSHSLSIIVCDIDTLKNINETFGHRAGDQMLIGFAQIALQSIRRDIDTVARWGEDEFLLVLPETPIRGAGRVAMRLREQFAQFNFTVDTHLVNSTASFGAAGFAPEAPGRNTDIDDLLLIADRCLHQAKAAGGNQVLCCP